MLLCAFYLSPAPLDRFRTDRILTDRISSHARSDCPTCVSRFDPTVCQPIGERMIRFVQADSGRPDAEPSLEFPMCCTMNILSIWTRRSRGSDLIISSCCFYSWSDII